MGFKSISMIKVKLAFIMAIWDRKIKIALLSDSIRGTTISKALMRMN